MQVHHHAGMHAHFSCGLQQAVTRDAVHLLPYRKQFREDYSTHFPRSYAVQYGSDMHEHRHPAYGCRVQLGSQCSGGCLSMYQGATLLSAYSWLASGGLRWCLKAVHDRVLQGIVQSAFLWGYTLTQYLGGSLADRYGGIILVVSMPLHSCRL